MEKGGFIAWFRDLSNKDVEIVGGKGASLAEMYNIRLPVPAGFAVTAQTYKYFVETTGIQSQILSMLDGLDVEDTQKLQDVANEIQELICKTPMPDSIKREIVESYDNLNVNTSLYNSISKDALSIIKTGRDLPFVAVRSSATAEDLPEASFAGQQATFVNVKGNERVVVAVQKCWASLYTARAIYYRVQNNFDHSKVFIAVIVQKMVDSEKAGVMFTANPVNSNKEEIVIDAAFGLGDAVVAGEITADNYVVAKDDFTLKSKRLGRQEWMYARDERGQTYKKTLSEIKGNKQKLEDEEIDGLARYAAQIENHYKKPMDIEWAIEGHKIYIVQARPITTLEKTEGTHEEVETSDKPALEGLGASPGVGIGCVKIVHDMNELDLVNDGDVLVTKMTDPDYVVAMKKARAIVTDEGSLTSHAAIVSRELGIPCVVGTMKATSVLKDGDKVTVDGTNGDVYLGEMECIREEEEKLAEETEEFVEEYKDVKTKTHLYMNLGEPEMIDKYKDLPFEAIGLMRVEFIVTSYVRKHPLAMMNDGEGPEFINKMAEGIGKVAEAIYPRPVIVRFSDFKTNEYRNLEGGAEFEPEEENPMIGWRGVSRYVSNSYKKAFRLECQAIRKVREQNNNVYVMLPFVRNVKEVGDCLTIMREEGLVRSSEFKIYLMAEVPSVAIIPEDFAKLDIDGASIGSNDLTQLVLGVDRDSSILGTMGYFDERNDAVKKAIVQIIEGFQKHGKSVSICGQAPSVYPEIAEFLVKKGIDAISVNPDVVEKTHSIIAKIEEEKF